MRNSIVRIFILVTTQGFSLLGIGFYTFPANMFWLTVLCKFLTFNFWGGQCACRHGNHCRCRKLQRSFSQKHFKHVISSKLQKYNIISFQPTQDPICCVCASDKMLIVVRKNIFPFLVQAFHLDLWSTSDVEVLAHIQPNVRTFLNLWMINTCK